MDAIQLLKQDHEKVKGLLKDFEAAPTGQPEQRRRLAEQIIQELMIHERIEEEIFYPAFKRMLGAQGAKEVQHSKEEHALVDSLIAQLTAIDLGDPDFEGTMRVLRENVEHHIRDEETKMFPLAQQRMSAELLGLGEDMLEYKETLRRELEGSATPRRDAKPPPRQR